MARGDGMMSDVECSGNAAGAVSANKPQEQNPATNENLNNDLHSQPPSERQNFMQLL